MNKDVVVIMGLVLFIAGSVGIGQWKEKKDRDAEYAAIINKSKRIEKEIASLNRFKDKKIPLITKSLAEINNEVHRYLSQFNRKVIMRFDEIKEEPLAGISASSGIEEVRFTLSFNDINSEEEMLRVINLLRRLKSLYPIRFEKYEGFRLYLHASGIVFGGKGSSV